MEIFTGSVSFRQLVIIAFVAFRVETRSNSIETKLSERFGALNITVGALIITVDELSRNAIRKFW